MMKNPIFDLENGGSTYTRINTVCYSVTKKNGEFLQVKLSDKNKMPALANIKYCNFRFYCFSLISIKWYLHIYDCWSENLKKYNANKTSNSSPCPFFFHLLNTLLHNNILLHNRLRSLGRNVCPNANVNNNQHFGRDERRETAYHIFWRPLVSLWCAHGFPRSQIQYLQIFIFFFWNFWNKTFNEILLYR